MESQTDKKRTVRPRGTQRHQSVIARAVTPHFPEQHSYGCKLIESADVEVGIN